LQDARRLVAQPLLVLIAILYLAGAASLIAFFPTEGPAKPAAAPAQDAQAQFLGLWDQQPRVPLGVPADGAKVVIVKFNDWLCPSCKAAHLAYAPVLEKLEKAYPGAVKYVIKDYPLNPKCNFNIPQMLHPGSCNAAAGVRMALATGKAEALIAYLFANQEKLLPDPDGVKKAVENVAGIKDFDRQYATLLPDIQHDVADGGALKIAHTPTFFINGVRAESVDGLWLPPEYFELVVTHEIQKAAGSR
jgi:protein-disulfide isomerase